MKDVYWLVPDLLAGRPGPRLAPWDLEVLWAGGFRVVLSLNDEVDQAAIAAAGFTHGKFYFPPVLLLQSIESQAFLRLMDHATRFIHDQLAADRPTLVHCHAGRDRTGAVLAGYLIRYQGLSPDEATRLVRQANPVAMTAPGYDRMPGLFSQQLGDS